ncbi:MAG: DNA-protecting protein DprA [Chloroflexi bacterium]|nr:DNA-protecting protein DprA [Chloroflexota bacterium]
MTDPRYFIGFNLIPQIGPIKLRRLLDYFGDLAVAWTAGAHELAQAGLDKRALENFLTTRHTLDLDAELEKIQRAGIRALTWDDSEYPRRLKEISNPPIVLYVKGEIISEDEWAIAIVGTRRPTAYGREVTRQIATDLVNNHITIISGLARGIDSEAHRAALDARGRTLAVIGCGLDIIYPPENKKLTEQIIAQGALISEYPLGTAPEASNFPPRNRIISGLALGVLLTEGDFDTGARITIEYALEQDRETFAIPGSIFRKESNAGNKFIQEGEAKLVTSARDILEELNLTQIEQHQEVRTTIPENETEFALLKHLSFEPMHVDELRRESGLPIAVVSSTLALMELKGIIKQTGAMNYVRAREMQAEYKTANDK